eukprot:gene695-1331_t
MSSSKTVSVHYRNMTTSFENILVEGFVSQYFVSGTETASGHIRRRKRKYPGKGMRYSGSSMKDSCIGVIVISKASLGSDRHDVGPVTFSWHPDGNFLASAGRNGIVQITDRHGDIVDEIPMATTSPILGLSWDKDGDYLAILQDGNGVVPLWSLANRRITQLETNLRDPTFIAWSKTGPQLAVGTAKGNLLIYNKSSKKKFPIVGKHGKKISCGAWTSGGNKLVLGSEDRTLTISTETGDTLIHTELKHIPLETYFSNNLGSEMSSGGAKPGSEDDTVSANLGGKTLLLFNILDESQDPMELTFASREPNGPCKYGELAHHQWYDEGLLMIGFSEGWIIVVSTHANEIGEEKHSGKFHPGGLITFAYNPYLKRVATCGEDGVRLLDTRDFKEIRSDYIPSQDLEDGRVTQICWSPDGQILTVGTDSGNVYNFLAKMTVLNAYYKSTIAYLSSLREVSVMDAIRRSRPIDITLKIEPAILAVGGRHVAAGMNNRVYYHRIGTNNSQIVNEQEYLGTVRKILLNQNFAAILTDSKVMLHPIEPGPDSQRQSKTFPERDDSSKGRVTSIALTDDFLYFGTEGATVEIFYLPEWKILQAAEMRLGNNSAIKQIHPNASGTRIVIVDSNNTTHLFNPVAGGGTNKSITRFDDAPMFVQGVLWDVVQSHVVMLFDGKFMHTYTYAPSSVKGPLLLKLGPVEIADDGSVALIPEKCEMPPASTPVISVDGSITCQTVAGALNSFVHPFFDHLSSNPAASHPRRVTSEALIQRTRFGQALGLLLLENAWQTALELNKRQFWLALSGKAMELLNVDLASRVYRQLGDAGMVMALRDCVAVEDKLLLAGHISLLFCDYQRAQEFFLASSKPTKALDMHRDLLHWEEALALARTIAPLQVPDICLKFGQQLEFQDRIDDALQMFDSALNAQNEEGRHICPEELLTSASIGVARCNLRLGNVRRGMQQANELGDRRLFEDCGEILESQKQYSEAADMFLKAEKFERAAGIYTKYLLISDKGRIMEAARILERVDNDHINSSFAKICVSAGRYDEAAKAYSRAKDMDKVVELKLTHLNQVGEAFDLVRQTCSAQSATLVANFCHKERNFRGAIEFLLMANKSEEAFRLAQGESLMETYTSILGDHITVEDARKVASHYEKLQEYGQAGRFYSLCGQYPRALKLFLQCGDREIDAAIEVVGKSQNESLTHQLIDFLVGEKDGVPKDPNYIYRLYMALRKYEDAAKTALIIARQEQDMGNYALAHAVIVETVRQLEDAGVKVSLQLRSHFVLLHSYTLVKRLVKSGDHSGAARMLLRVAQSVSKFPQHVVPILTSTVIECQRAGLKASSYEYAVMLMRPEHRSKFDDVNLRRKIEAIVRRKGSNTDDSQEEMSPCPISSEMVPWSTLECPTTRDAIPMCVVTGRHMVINDWCFCPVSRFPALYSEYLIYIDSASSISASASQEDFKEKESEPESKSSSRSRKTQGALDPVMGKPVQREDLRKVPADEAMKYIQRYNNVKDDEKEKEEAAAAEAAATGGGGTGAGDEETKPRSTKGKLPPRDEMDSRDRFS